MVPAMAVTMILPTDQRTLMPRSIAATVWRFSPCAGTTWVSATVTSPTRSAPYSPTRPGYSWRSAPEARSPARRRGTTDLAQTTLISDGTTVYEATSDAEIIDLLHGGQGVFAIAVGHTLTDLAGTVHQFPAEDATPTTAAAADDLAQRRRKVIVSEAV